MKKTWLVKWLAVELNQYLSATLNPSDDVVFLPSKVSTYPLKGVLKDINFD